MSRCRICGAVLSKDEEGICRECRRCGDPFGEKFEKMIDKVIGGPEKGRNKSIRIQHNDEGTRIDVSGDVDVDELKKQYGKEAEIYKDGKRIDEPIVEVIEEEEEKA